MNEWLQIAITFLNTVTIALTLAFTIRHFKISRSVSYIERFNSPAIADLRTVVDEWLSQACSPEQKLKFEFIYRDFRKMCDKDVDL